MPASIFLMEAANAIPDEHHRRLVLFNEQAEILLRSRFAATMFGSVTGVTLSWEEGGSLETKVKGPDEEAVRAFALTFRMFFRDADGISFREMAEIYEAPHVPGALREDYRWARHAVNEFLDGLTMCQVNGERVTRRHVVDVFLYGGLAHLNLNKRRVYDSWRGHPILFALMQNEFTVALAEFFNHVRFVREVNLALLRGDQRLSDD